MNTPLGRHIHNALFEFGPWYLMEDYWGGLKSWATLFIQFFLSHKISPGSVEQIRIAHRPAQPKGCSEHVSTKDLIIWKNPLVAAWEPDQKYLNPPLALIKWKTSTSGRLPGRLDAEDEKWLAAFTKAHPHVIGFVVSVHTTKRHRRCLW